MTKEMRNSNLPNRKKLLNSKWTAIKPEGKEKHFNVTRVKLDDDDDQIIEFIILTAVLTNKNYKIDYKDLKNELNWKQGWK
jgi:tryptophan-rich hypothetical protein